MTTIKEIARLSGVSRGTVDRVLNNRDGVSEETAERVRTIAKQLGYKPNKAGVALAAQK
nr:LacI family DNA-binding transcriptional regulator [Lachnospiraceae bacterium]